MGARKRLFLLIGIMAVVSLLVTWSATYFLYRHDLTHIGPHPDDLAQVRVSFLWAGLFGSLLALGLVLLAAIFFLRVADPLIQRAEESEQRFRALFDQSFQFLWTLKPDGTLVEANRTALDFSGLAPTTVQGKPLWKTRWWCGMPNAMERLETAVEQAAAGSLARDEFELRGFGDRVATVDFSLKPVTDRRGEVSLLIAEGRDISERKRAEWRLAQRTAYLNALLQRSPLGIVTLDGQGKVQQCNPAFEQMFQFSEKEIVGGQLDALISAPQNWDEPFNITRQVVGGEAVRLVTQRRRRDGTLVDVALHAVPLVVNGEVVGGYGLYEEISERRRSEEERERLIGELREALASVKTLRGLLPICASCKNVRDDQGYWNQIEKYVAAHSEAEFSHGICPECARRLYPEHYHRMFPEPDEEKKANG